jgi:molybdopterin biosynthesis enzyme
MHTVDILYHFQVVDPTTKVLKEGQIYDSNRSTLNAALKEQGFPVADMGIAMDKLVQDNSHFF